MARWLSLACVFACSLSVLGCNDELVQDVPQSVCWSGKQWIGGKRGSPEMYPGRDCVGCHLENDGPELMLGGTIYPYTSVAYTDEQVARLNELQTGEDCFGLEGPRITIEGGDGQVFEVTANRAGNFYVEGKPSDLVKPFQVRVEWENPRTGMLDTPRMGTQPSYGGCARCHTPGVQADPDNPPATKDEDIVPAGSRVGIPGYVQISDLEALVGEEP